uniref:Uncharacterized protein n=1 Tax=Leersia perrieri TaxID=77586 RepID=A0A0D9WG04_9ORYZ
MASQAVCLAQEEDPVGRAATVSRTLPGLTNDSLAVRSVIIDAREAALAAPESEFAAACTRAATGTSVMPIASAAPAGCLVPSHNLPRHS